MSVVHSWVRILRATSITSLAAVAAITSQPALSAVIEEIIVTARATEETVRDIPVAITAVSEERLDQYGLESFMDLEAITPQLVIGRASSGSGATIAIRGIGSSASSIGIEQSVAVVIDGVYFPQGRVINEGLFDVSQVAILKGPQALYFGKNATAGVVSLQTNNPGEEFEASARINHEFDSEDMTVEGIISFPVNDKLGLRLAVQASDMDKGWIKNNGRADGDIYITNDGFTGDQNPFDNPKAAPVWPQEETLYFRLTAAGDLTDRLSYNIKGSFGRFEQNSSTGGGELFNCSTLNGVGHESVPAAIQPGGRPSVLFVPEARPTVDCGFDGARGINNVPPEVAATNPLLDQFGNGSAGEKFESYVLTGTFDWELDNVDVQAILNYQDQDERWVGDQDGGDVTSIFAAEHNTFQNISAEFRAVTRFEQPVNFVLGLYYQDTERFFDQDVNFGRVQWSGPIVNPDDEFTAYNKISETDGETISPYGEVIWDITDQLQLTAGARYLHETKDSFFIQPYVAPYSFFQIFFIEHDPSNILTRAVDDSTYKNLIPEVTLRWEPTDDLTFYVAYKEGFKSGGFSNSAILSNLSPPLVNGSPCVVPPFGTCPGAVAGDDIVFSDFVFDPEENKGGEIGVKASLFENSMLASFEIFYYEFTDLQVDFFNSQQFAFVTENAGGSETYGAELQIDYATPIEGLTVSGSIGYLESKFTEFEAFCFVGQTPAQGCAFGPGQTEAQLRQDLKGNTRPGAPKWSGFVAANYERPFANNLLLGVSSNLQFKSKSILSSSDPNATYKSYSTLDANVRVGTQDGKWQLALIGKNLTDKLAIRGAGNVPGTGGNTGTNEGFRGDLSGGAIRPRQIELELTFRY
jgi:iron complex outermembrane receptor protein